MENKIKKKKWGRRKIKSRKYNAAVLEQKYSM